MEAQCPNCGSKKLIVVNGKVKCGSCDSILPEIPLREINPKEAIRFEEIERLKTNPRLSPKTDVLTDEEVLRYAPQSKKARSIRTERADDFIGKLKVNNLYRRYLIVAVIIAVGFLLAVSLDELHRILGLMIIIYGFMGVLLVVSLDADINYNRKSIFDFSFLKK